MDLTTIATRDSLEKQKLPQKLYAKFYVYGLRIAFRYLHDYERATAVANVAFADIFKNSGYLEFYGDEHRFKDLITKTTVMKVLEVYDWDATGGALNIRADQMIWQALSPVDHDARLVSLLALLPTMHRALFNMHVIDGFAISEIAKHLHLAEAFCASQLQEARTLLKNLVTNDSQLG